MEMTDYNSSLEQLQSITNWEIIEDNAGHLYLAISDLHGYCIAIYSCYDCDCSPAILLNDTKRGLGKVVADSRGSSDITVLAGRKELNYLYGEGPKRLRIKISEHSLYNVAQYSALIGDKIPALHLYYDATMAVVHGSVFRIVPLGNVSYVTTIYRPVTIPQLLDIITSELAKIKRGEAT